MQDVSDNQLDRGGEMSTPDSKLSAAERAALADLEAAAAAADPSLAALLRGGARWRPLPAIRSVALRLLRLWAVVLGLGWAGVPMSLGGLLLMVLGLSSGLAVSLVGLLFAFVGLRVLVEMLRLRLPRPRSTQQDG